MRRHLVRIAVLAVVAWGAVAGGAWGLGFAIFVGLSYLEDISTQLSKPEPAPPAPPPTTTLPL